jgi:hypothetical protein
MAWFDELACDTFCDGEFCEPVHPEILLEPAPEVIWPGLMPPDLLPLVGNTVGDWLCARVAADNSIAEVVYWYHGGGDHLPYGRSIAEALVYDSLTARFPGRARGLAIPAQSPQPQSRSPLRERAGVRWALQHLPPSVAEVFDADFPVQQTDVRLLELGVSEVAIRCDMALAALDNEVRRRMTPQVAAMLDARWDQDVVQWMFDPAHMPDHVVQRLAQHWQLPADRWQHQNWNLAANHCRSIAASRSDLAWTHDILGWAAHRSGDTVAAIDHYGRGAMASLFTDQSVRFRTHFDSDRICKFSVARLAELNATTQIDPDYVQTLSVAQSPADREATGWRDSVCKYWLSLAEKTVASEYIAAVDRESAAYRYELVYRAGWDVGCDSIKRYQQLLNNLVEAAEAAGQAARAELAKAHRDCLQARYLIS